MASSSLSAERILGALLRGAAAPPRRRRRTTKASNSGLINISLGSGSSRGLNSALGALATIAATALAKSLSGGGQAAPAPTPAPARSPRRSVDVQPSAGVPSTGATPWTPPPVEASGPDADSAEALLLIRAAIAAAKADGVLDKDERTHIAGQLDAAGLSAEERDYVLRDLDSPLDVAAIAKEARDPMLAAQVYAAAVAAAGEISAAERAFLDALGSKLRLDKAATAAIEARLGGA